jgi:hypothetical protein
MGTCIDLLGRIEQNGYRRLKVREDGTCRAGPFTFDIHDGKLEIFLKKESICPLVGHLKYYPEAYRQQYEHAVQNLASLVQALPACELSEILKVDEPETEKVAEIPLQDLT